MFCCVFCFASCLGQAFSQTWQQLLACRLLLGFGVGPKSATIPIYAAESVPSEEIRGAIVMTWQLCTAFGIMLGYIFTYVFQDLPHHLGWRFMVGSPMVAPAILFFLMLALPESPRWHLLRAKQLETGRSPNRLKIIKQYDKAFHALRLLRHIKLQAARDLYTIDIWLRMDRPQFDQPQSSTDSQEDHLGRRLKSRLKTWFPDIFILFKDPRCVRAMCSGLIVLSLQQLCGINVFAYYSSSVFSDSLTGNQDRKHIALRVRSPGEIQCASADSETVLAWGRWNKFWPGNCGALPYRQRWPPSIVGPYITVDERLPVCDRLYLWKKNPSCRPLASHSGCDIWISILCLLQHWRGTSAISKNALAIIKTAAKSSGLRVGNSSPRSERYR